MSIRAHAETKPALKTSSSSPTELRDMDRSFEIQDRNIAPGQPTVNLLLFEAKENRARRDQVSHLDDTFLTLAQAIDLGNTDQ